MNSWTDIEARKKAVSAFIEHLHKPGNEAERAKCAIDHDYAKGLFAHLGGFELQEDAYPDQPTKIPKKLEIRIYEEKDTSTRDHDLGIMLVPAKLQLPVDVSAVWLCTWAEWTSKGAQSKSSESPEAKR